MRIKVGKHFYIFAEEAGLNQGTTRNKAKHLIDRGKDPLSHGYVKLRGGWYVREDKTKPKAPEGQENIKDET